MTVAPRYAEYSDALDTGVSVPLQLPCMAAPPARDAGAERLWASPALQAAAPAGGNPADAASSRLDGVHSAASPPLPETCTDESSAAAGAQCDESREGGGQLPAAGELPAPRARYFLCRRHRVDRVFVEHPIYHNTTDIYGSNVNTYVEAGQFPDLDVRYSILCQAALAAPLLLWAGDSSKSPAAAEDHPSAAAGVNAAGAASLGEAQQGSAGLVFVGNDWPCAPLALRLSLNRQAAQQAPGTPAPDSAADGQAQASPTDSAAHAADAAATDAPRQTNDSRHSDSRDVGADSSGAREGAEATLLAGASPEGGAPAAAGDGGFAARLQGSLRGAASAFCIHNLAYQGCCAAETFPRLCLPDAALPALLWPPPDPKPQGPAPAVEQPPPPVLPENAEHEGISTGALRSAALAPHGSGFIGCPLLAAKPCAVLQSVRHEHANWVQAVRKRALTS